MATDLGQSMAPYQMDRRNFWNTGAGQMANPYAGFSSQIQGYTAGMGNPLATPWGAAGTAGASGGAGGGTWGGMHVARPGDQEVQDYSNAMMSQQRQATNDYVRRAGTAGIQRGGMNVAGGPALNSALHNQAIGTLAAGAASRFGAAMDYNKYLKNTEWDQAQAETTNRMRLLELQRQALADQAGWDTATRNLQREDYGADLGAGLSWAQAAPERQWQAQQRNMQNQQAQYAWDQQNAQNANVRNLYVGNAAGPTHASPYDRTTQQNEYLRAIGATRR